MIKPQGYENFRNVREVAELLGVSVRTIEYKISNGEVPEPYVSMQGVRLWGPEDCSMILALHMAQLPSAKKAAKRVF